MEIVDKQYVDNIEVVGVTTPANVSQTNLKVTEDDRLATLSKRGGVIKIGLDSLGNYYINKKIELPDNLGNIKLVLIADCTQWYNSGEDNTKKVNLTGFTGRIHCIRNSGYNIALEGPVNAFVLYISNYGNNENVIRLESSINVCRPVIVKYLDKYYVALSFQGSGYVVKLEGFLSNNLDEFIILKGTTNEHLLPTDGIEYVLTDYSKTYYRHRVEKAQISEFANSVKDLSISLNKLNYLLNKPFSKNPISNLDNINFDTISNLIYNTYGANGNEALPTFAVSYLTSLNENDLHVRQLMYEPNLGTFQRRSKNVNSDTWGAWYPIPIPQTSVLHKSYLKSKHIDTLTTSGFYVLTNNSAINYSTLSEFIVVHNNNIGQVFQTHYGGNGGIKGRVGALQANGTVTWNNWDVKTYTYNISYDNNGIYTYNNTTTVWDNMTVSKFNEIVNGLHLPNIKCKGRIKHDTNNYSTCDVKLYKKNSLLISHFDFDTNQTVYNKVYVEGEAIKTTTKRINHTV